MKKLLLSIFICSLFPSASNIYADTFVSVGVFSDVREYDQTDFPGQSRISRMMVYAEVAEDPATDTVTVDSNPTGNGASLGWDSGNKLWARLYSNPPIGSDWQTTYTFHSGSSVFNLDISACTIQELPVPNPTISPDGRTISWNAVNGATYYSIYWYPLTNGLPDESGGPLVKIDRIYDTSLTLSNPTPGTYALRLNAHEQCSGVTVNRSTIYKKHVIPYEINAPSIVEGNLSDFRVWDDYMFTLPYHSYVTISLFSTDFNTYLILLGGNSGHKLAEDDDGHLDWGQNEEYDSLGTNSEISAWLIPNPYIIRVRSNGVTTGSYTLVVRDIGNNAIETLCDKLDQYYPAVFPGPNYPPLSTLFSPNEWVNDWVAKWKKVGGDTCVGRCGKGCPGDGEPSCDDKFRYTLDCFNHDVCADEYGSRLDLRCDRVADNTGDDCLLALECAGTHYVDYSLTCGGVETPCCGGKLPCYHTIQAAIDAAVSGSIIKIGQGRYSYGGEAIILNTSKKLILQGGWDSTFTSQTSNSTIIKAPKATQGSLTLQMLTIRP